MERSTLLLLLVLALCAVAANPALARRSSRKLNGSYSKSSSSPSTPYTSPSTPSSSSPSTPSPVVTPTPTPVVTPAPVVPTPTPVTIPPVTASPKGGYGGYGSRTGKGTSGFLGKVPKALPKLLSLVSSIAKIFGPRLLKFFKGRKAPSVLGALKDTSPMAMTSLAREATASFINAYRVQGFPLSTAQVVSQFNAALESPELAAKQAAVFQSMNEMV